MININETSLMGFNYGLRRPSLQLNIQWLIPRNFSIEAIKAEMLDRFQIEHQEIKYKLKRELKETEKLASQFAWETLGLACHLLQAIKIPCFDRGVILDIQEIQEKEGHYLISLMFPYEEHHPILWINRCLSWSLKIILQIIQIKNGQIEKLEQLFKELDEKFIETAKKEVYGGGSTIPLLKMAYNMGIPYKHISWGIYQLGWANKLHITDRSTTELDSALGRNISHNKFQTAQMLRKAGLPAPVHYLVTTTEMAMDAANKIGYPVVVKPADKDRGEGVTVNVSDNEGVRKAYENASLISRKILIEKQVAGICYRILVIGEKEIYTVGRMPIAVVGDGINSINELILHANEREMRKAKHLRLKLFPSDELAKETLKNQDYLFSSIPKLGDFVKLRPIETTEWGGLPRVIESIHPENSRIIIQAAKTLNLYTAGVDFITDDISKPWYENGAIINEMNFAPFLGTRYEYQRDGVRAILKLLFPKGGRIPVEIYIGNDDAWNAATKRQKELSKLGINTFVTSHLKTVDADEEIHLSLGQDGLYFRTLALLMNKDLGALIMVVQTDELISKGLPVDSIDSVFIVNNKLKLLDDSSYLKREAIVAMLIELINPYLISKFDDKK